MTDASERNGGSAGDKRAGRQGPKPPKRVSLEYLERAALHYLERYASSSANLRRVLMRKVHRSAQFHGTDPEEGARWVEDLVQRYTGSGLLNDTAYAEMKASGLQRRGGSTRMIRQKLAAKGVGAAEIDQAMGGLEGAEEGRAELEAAIAYARRRRLGPFRDAVRRDRLAESGEERARFDKDLAAMARAGFDLGTARQVLEAEDPDML
ncbi:regulatory protein RecX [Indioceanicola profundi]|uniref:regulatory protein RecX n=1 Tax=Indioceanicola profundi TaxID=2220096 RepID=UPI000E6ABB89|nr:regulatory protein RecX [Indioceanicola profundi]